MFDFFDGYKKWARLDVEQKKKTLMDCARFYEGKTVDYVLAYLPENMKKKFSKTPVVLEWTVVQTAGQNVSFGDNVVYVLSSLLLMEGKKSLFFEVAKNTIYAVFFHLFNSTATSPSKKTRFGELANVYFASITSEFCAHQDFEKDMMELITLSFEAAQEKSL